MRVGGQGFGLSYANFTFGKPAISAASASAVDTVHITIPVTNTATRDGRTVVQLYSEAPIVYGLGHFQRTLVGFAKVFVAGGSTATATIALKVKDLGRWSPQVILPTAPGVSNEGGSSPLLVPLPAVSWPWLPAWGSLEPPRRDGENAQKTRKNGEEMGEIWPKECEHR